MNCKTMFLNNRNLVVLISFVALLSSCATKKMTFATSPIMPAATGSVKVKKDNNNNYAVDLKVLHLAPSGRLTPPKKTYIVWMRTADNGTQNIGQLNSSSSLLSKTLKGELETVTTYKPESFFITAEDDATIQNPNNYVILQTQ